jgi:putative toxin-antitoxin system antitoxin component (TIGR02293 family)
MKTRKVSSTLKSSAKTGTIKPDRIKKFTDYKLTREVQSLDIKHQELNEPAVMFNRSNDTTKNFLSAVMDQVLLISLKGKPEYRMTSIEKMELSEDGISKKALQNLKDKAQLDYNQLAKVLNVARATLINKKGNEKFSRDVSDKILGLADIYSYGYEVFEDMNRFNEWVFRENKALGGKTPFDLLHNSFGREEVKHLIGRIDYGVYS